MRDPDARLRKLEAMYTRPKTCPQCFDHPFRVVISSGDEVMDENFPEDGCPGCGRPIAQELHIVGEPDDDEKVTGC